jgi:hypothetical protein
MLRICVIGNSQLAACKMGWKDIRREYPDIELTFFGVLRDEVENLAIAGDALVPQSERLREHLAVTSKGKGEIAGDYDRYILWGLYFYVIPAARAYNNRRAEGGADARVLMDAVKIRLRGSPSMKALTKLRVISGAPIAVVPDLMMSEAKLSEHLEETVRNGEQELIASVFRTAVSELGEELGFTPLFQVPETLANPLQTKLAFSAGVTPSGAPDVYHGNREFGALQLRSLLSSPFCAA